MFINSSHCLPLRVRPCGLYSSTLTDAGTVAAYYPFMQNLVRSSKMYSHKASHAPLINRLLSVCFPLCYFFLSLLFLIKSLEYEIEVIINTTKSSCQGELGLLTYHISKTVLHFFTYFILIIHQRLFCMTLLILSVPPSHYFPTKSIHFPEFQFLPLFPNLLFPVFQPCVQYPYNTLCP